VSRLNKDEMRKLASEYLSNYRSKKHDELRELVESDQVDTLEIKGPSGSRYIIEVRFGWDDESAGEIRVDLTIDEDPHRPLFGFLPVYISTIGDGFIMKPDGTFIDEEQHTN